MKIEKKVKPSDSNLRIIELCSIIALLFLKLLYFYVYTGIGIHALTLLLESAVLISLAWFLFSVIKKRVPYGLTYGIYIFVSVVMLINLMYFNFFGKLPSLFMLSNTGFVGDVGASVLKLLSFSSLVPIIDLPILAVYIFVIRKSIIEKDTPITVFPRFKKAVTAFLIASSIFFLGDVVLTKFQFLDMRNEFFVYYAVDIGRLVFGVKENEQDYNKSIRKDYENSALHGIAEGRNLIVIQAESLQGFTTLRSYNGKEITPNINRLIGNSSYFENYYFQTGGGNTSDAEFTVNNSLFAPEYESAYIKYANNSYYGLPWILKENGFNTAVAYHAFKGSFWNRESAYINQGFDNFISREDTDVLTGGEYIGLGLNDKDFLMQSLEHIKTLEKPFYSFLITLTSHHPYIMPFENRFDILPEDVGSTFADYISSINYIDECIGEFIEGLKKEGLYDNSVIVIYGDHFAIPLNEKGSLESFERLMGHPYDYDDFLRVPCIIAVPGLEGEAAELLAKPQKVTGGHADLMPTILDLFGYKSDKMIMMGQNLYAAKTGIVYPQASLQRGSFVDDEKVFVFPQNKMLMNAVAFKKSDKTPIEPDECLKQYEDALSAYADSSYILEHNIIADIIKNGRDETLKLIEDEIKYEQGQECIIEENMEKDILHRAIKIKPSEITGTFVNSKISDGLLVLDENQSYGYYVSESIFIGKFHTLVASWKATGTTDVSISIAYDLDDGKFSGFYSFGKWSTKKGVSASHSSSNNNGHLNTDTFYAHSEGTQVKVKVELFANSSSKTKTSGLEYIVITGDFEQKLVFFNISEKVFIDVPRRSQMVVPKIGNRICSPTSVAMVLEYYGTNLPTTTVARGVYDNSTKIYGNWSFNTAYAASLGYNAYVDTFDLNALKYTLSRGIPVICSIATYDKAQLEGSPMAYPSGHLVVACGYEQIGGVTYINFNDPAAPTADTVRRSYRADQFERVWNGIVYIITKS